MSSGAVIKLSKILENKYFKKIAQELREEDILPHLQNSLSELKADVDYLVQYGQVPRQQIINFIIKELNKDDKVKSAEEQFLSALQELTDRSQPGSLLSIAELRQMLPFSKEEFDRLALKLSHEYKISLHQHDLPFSLSENARNKLVYDPKSKNYFLGIALRHQS